MPQVKLSQKLKQLGPDATKVAAANVDKWKKLRTRLFNDISPDLFIDEKDFQQMKLDFQKMIEELKVDDKEFEAFLLRHELRLNEKERHKRKLLKEQMKDAAVKDEKDPDWIRPYEQSSIDWLIRLALIAKEVLFKPADVSLDSNGLDLEWVALLNLSGDFGDLDDPELVKDIMTSFCECINRSLMVETQETAAKTADISALNGLKVFNLINNYYQRVLLDPKEADTLKKDKPLELSPAGSPRSAASKESSSANLDDSSDPSMLDSPESSASSNSSPGSSPPVSPRSAQDSKEVSASPLKNAIVKSRSMDTFSLFRSRHESAVHKHKPVVADESKLDKNLKSKAHRMFKGLVQLAKDAESYLGTTHSAVPQKQIHRAPIQSAGVISKP